jgi:hypothetical protein
MSDGALPSIGKGGTGRNSGSRRQSQVVSALLKIPRTKRQAFRRVQRLLRDESETLSKIFNRHFSAYIGIRRRISAFIGVTGFEKLSLWYDLAL